MKILFMMMLVFGMNFSMAASTAGDTGQTDSVSAATICQEELNKNSTDAAQKEAEAAAQALSK